GPPSVTEPEPPWPYVTDDEIEAVRTNLLLSREDWTYITSCAKGGPSQRLEELMKKALGVEFALATAGCGPALDLACMSVLEMGDEAITTPYSWSQTTACILHAGGVPIFADIDPNTLTMDPRSLASKVTPRTKAIVVVHLGGVPADMDAIMDIAQK